jgi:glycosyltransferase involved in cell wall biosynthesis
MRLAWITPFTRRSAIGRYSAGVVEALVARGHHVMIVSAEPEPSVDHHPIPRGAKQLHWRDQKTTAALTDADIRIYQVGDNSDFHLGVVALLDAYPGICVFHDSYVLNLFLGWLRSIPDGSVDAHGVVERLYGQDVAAQFDARPVHEQDPAWLADQVPMTEWLAQKAIACVAHAPFYAERLERACPGPVAVLPLAYDSRQPSTQGATPTHHRLRLLTVGHVNPNKRVHDVIEALASSPGLQDGYRYDVVGFIEPSMRGRLEDLIHSHGLQECVTVHGEVDDDTLQDFLREADVISGLRWPALEGASASTIEGMLAGKPVIVTDVGFYQTLPDSCVLKVRPGHAVPDVAAHLGRLAGDPSLRIRMGRDARAWAAVEFSAARYAESLERLCLDTIPLIDHVVAVRQLAALLAGFGVPATDPLVDRVGQAMSTLFLSWDGQALPRSGT